MTDHREIPEPMHAPAGVPPVDFPEDAPEPERVRAPVTAKRVALVGARVITGAVGIGVGVAAPPPPPPPPPITGGTAGSW